MKVRRVLFDKNLLLHLLFNKAAALESETFIWNLIRTGRIEGHITSITLGEVYCYATLMVGEETAQEITDNLRVALRCLPVTQETMKAAPSIDFSIPTAVQVACALEWNLDGILTSNPFDFSKAELQELSIFTIGQLIVDHLIPSLEEHPELVEQQFFSASVSGRGESKTVTAALRLERIKVFCGDRRPRAIAIVQLPSGQICQECASGNGPIDAAYKAVNKALSQCRNIPEHHLIHYAVQATTEDSEGSVVILLQSGDALFPGRSFHTDTVFASVYAYIDAVNYMLQCLHLTEEV